MKNQITLQTRGGEVEANIISVENGYMVAEFELNGELFSGNVDDRNSILKISETSAARIKETPAQLSQMYDDCFEINFDEPFLETNHNGERMVRKGIKTNLFTGQVENIEKVIWSK